MSNIPKLVFVILLLTICVCCSCLKNDNFNDETLPTPSINFQTTDNNLKIATNTLIPEVIPTTTPEPTTTIKVFSTVEYKPITTISPQDAKEYIRSVVNSLEKCDSPCWGDFTLGVTTIEEVHDALGIISEPILLTEDKVIMNEQGEEVLYSVETWRRDFGDSFVVWFIQADDHIINELHFSTDVVNDLFGFILETYGKPDEIWVLGWIPDFDEEIIHLGLYYQDQRSFMWFTMGGYIEDGFQKACGINLYQMIIWAETHESLAFFDLYKGFFGGERAGYRDQYNLETITDWTINSFYEENREKDDADICISLPLEN
jgi:hypothetical protein